jgi:multidrug efflux pump subunit AcrB
VKTAGGEVLLRTKEKRLDGEAFAAITLLSRPDGPRVTVGDVATVRDTLAENDKAAYFDGKPAVQLKVYRTGNQKPLEIAAIVKEFAERVQVEMPAEISLAVWNDGSEIFGDRINLLLKNVALGLFLVLVLLGLFLKPSQAFWVTTGMVISFCGAFVIMPLIGVTINMISLFAFILTLGIVVDDAIVVGESVHYHSQRGKRPLAAALTGVREVAIPVTFSVLTTVIAFTPLLFIPGLMGKFFSNIPAIVIPILLFSLVESLLILPAHLSHGKTLPIPGLKKFTAWQQRFSDGFDRWTETKFDKFIRAALARRGLILAGTLALVIVAFGVLKGGRLAFTFMPKIEGDIVMTTVELPFGSPVEETRAALERVQSGARRVLAKLDGGSEGNLRGMFAQIGASVAGSGPMADASGGGSHVAQMTVQLRPLGERSVTAREFAGLLRQEVRSRPGCR